MNTTGGSEQRSPNIHRQSDMGQSGILEILLGKKGLCVFKMMPETRSVIG